MSHPSTVPKQETLYDIRRCMISKGYRVRNEALTKTLQGSVWCGVNLKGSHFNRNIVIKVSKKHLYYSRMTVANNKRIQIEEDILSEMRILKYLTHYGTYFGLNRFIVNYIDFFADSKHFYLVMENGGLSLFNFVSNGHKYLSAGKITIIQWKNQCKLIFKQMVTFLNIMHMMNVCHLDISLENVVIHASSSLFTVNPAKTDIQLIPKLNIKFCDFGLSEIFNKKTNPKFLCNKWVGKIGYQSPEIYDKKPNFNAKAADVWSLGVCLFALLTGSMPYNTPTASDPAFQWLITGHVSKLANKWHKSCYLNSSSADVLYRIFKKENQRISTQKLLQHAWIRSITKG